MWAAEEAANVLGMDKTFRAYSLDQRLLLPLCRRLPGRPASESER
jgi:hypothetical protein